MIRLAFETLHHLPRLVWVACLERGGDVVRVSHGPWIETSETWFAEGAWDGEFAEGHPADAMVLTGTAGEVREDTLVISTPTHTLDRIHLIRSGGRLYTSNSLALVLAAAGEACACGYRYYMHDLATIMKGIRGYRKHVPTQSGNRVYLYYHCILHVDSGLNVRVLPKPVPPAVRSYGDYYGFLSRMVEAVVQNARSSHRLVAYEPLIGISAGYDSAACAVLAREVGCTEGFTFPRARPRPGTSDEDSGKTIGELLGIRMIECDRDTYLERTDRPEIEFLASGTGGDLVIMSGIEGILERRILLTGDHGDTVWDKDSPRVSTEIKRGDPGAALTDFRGRVGFLIFPIPFIGAVNHPQIDGISNSAEMRPWSLARDYYDRPIARRMAEDCGIPRETIGQSKQAVAQTFHPTTGEHEPLETMLSSPALQDFWVFYEALPASAKWRGERVSRLLRGALWLNLRLNWRIKRFGELLGVDVKPWICIPERYRLTPAPNDFTFHWAIGEMIERYQRVLKREIYQSNGERSTRA